MNGVGVKPKAIRLKSADRKAEIVRVSIELARDRNVDSITTERIAKELGLTQGAIFRHFAKKEDIWLAAVAWIDQVMLEAVEDILRSPQGPLDEIRSVFLCLADLLAKHPGMAQVMFHELQRPDDLASKENMQACMNHISDKLEAAIERGKDNDEIPKHIDKRVGVRMLLGALDGLATQAAVDGNPCATGLEARQLFPLLRNALSN